MSFKRMTTSCCGVHGIIKTGRFEHVALIDAKPGDVIEFVGVDRNEDGSPDYDGSAVLVRCVLINVVTDRVEFDPFLEPGDKQPYVSESYFDVLRADWDGKEMSRIDAVLAMTGVRA